MAGPLFYHHQEYIMATYQEPIRDYESLLSEGEGSISREAVTLAEGAGTLSAGSVLGTVTASGHFAAYDPEADDGTETAIAVLMQTASAGQQATAIVRLAEVKKDALLWAVSLDAGQKATAYAELAQNFVLAR